MRRLPSNAKGFVTTATLSAPSSLASEATTGAAPLPVPPPRPAVMKIMSAPSNPSMIFSVSSSAALRPTSGFAPAHADDFDFRRLQVFTEAHADSCVSYCHAFSNLLQIRWWLPGRVTKRQRTWLSILIPDFPRAAARNAAPSRHTIQVQRSLHIPAAPPVPADQPSPLVPQCAQANGSNAPQVRRARAAARHRPP